MDVVITGSTKGLGLFLARRFLAEGDRVLISSRTQQNIDRVVDELNQSFPNQVIGHQVDVTDYNSVQSLAQFARDKFGNFDIWINNAGTNAYTHTLLYEQDPDQISSIISTNLTGTIYGCRAAINIMKNQDMGHIFNIDGLGSNGRIQKYYTAYTTSKRAIPYLTKSLVKETEDIPVHVHTASPGMVLTDLLIKNTKPSNRSIFNILAERPGTVADFLVPRIRSIATTNNDGEYIKYLTSFKAFLRFLTFWRWRNRFFNEEGKLLVELEGVTLDEDETT